MDRNNQENIVLGIIVFIIGCGIVLFVSQHLFVAAVIWVLSTALVVLVVLLFTSRWKTEEVPDWVSNPLRPEVGR